MYTATPKKGGSPRREASVLPKIAYAPVAAAHKSSLSRARMSLRVAVVVTTRRVCYVTIAHYVKCAANASRESIRQSAHTCTLSTLRIVCVMYTRDIEQIGRDPATCEYKLNITNTGGGGFSVNPSSLIGEKYQMKR